MQSTIDTTRNGHPVVAETPRKSAQGYYLRSTVTNMGFNPVQATITITDQHLLISPTWSFISLTWLIYIALGILKPVAFPLSRISKVAVYDKTVWKKRDVLQIEFDTGGREYVWVQPAHEWQAALLAARATATDQQYSTLPALKHGVEASRAKSAGKVLLVLIGIMIVAMLSCGVINALVATMR